ncbi:MAG: hypothetical protein KTR33_12620 [Gammaproteobacteria bacterium]|nr:hypothetical protein [Gammaproteobacteria bacterium]
MKGIFVILGLLAGLLSGCATLSPNRLSDGERITDSSAEQQVVSDLLFVMGQLLPPRNNTIQYQSADTSLSRAVTSGFRERGYGLQKVSADQGANFLNHEVTALAEADGGRQYRYTLGVGALSVERHYVDLGAQIYPASPMVVRGANSASASDVTLDLELFQIEDKDLSYLFRIEFRERDIPAIPVPSITLITNELVADIASSTVNTPDAVGLNSANREIKNLYFTNESNFSSATRGYRTIRRDVVIFDNDSMRLGETGKRKVRTISRQFEPDTDFIQLLGCSNGYTDLEIGNEGLALGRSRRVVEEFLSLGVDKSSLLDEGCWAPDNLDGRFPRRGVVIELKRRSR